MKYNFLFITLLLFAALTSCSQDETFIPNFSLPDSIFNKNSNFAVVDVFSVENKPLVIENIAKDISFTPLESIPKAYSKNVDDLVAGDSLILYNARGSIMYFNRKGKSLGKYQNIGRGPAEYTVIYGFAADFKNDIMAIANLGFIKLYRLDGTFLRALKLPGLPYAMSPVMAFMPGNKMLIENSRIKPDYSDGFSPLWMLNLKTGKAHPIFPENYPASTERFESKFTFEGELYRYGEGYRYMSRDSYNVYNIDKKGNVSLVYKLDFGEYNMPAGAVHDANNYIKLSLRFAVIWSIFETKRYLFIKYDIGRTWKNEQHTGYVVFDKQEKKVIAHQFETEGMPSKQYPGLSFWPEYVTKSGKLVCIFEAADIAETNAIPGIQKKDNRVLAIITLEDN